MIFTCSKDERMEVIAIVGVKGWQMIITIARMWKRCLVSLIAATEAVANGEKTTAYITSNGLSNKIASGEKRKRVMTKYQRGKQERMMGQTPWETKEEHEERGGKRERRKRERIRIKRDSSEYDMIILGHKMATPEPEVTTSGLKRANLKPGMLKHGSSLI